MEISKKQMDFIRNRLWNNDTVPKVYNIISETDDKENINEMNYFDDTFDDAYNEIFVEDDKKVC